MSGLIDTIVRRRRASASSRLGPPADALEDVPWVHEDPPAAEPVRAVPEPAYDQPPPVPEQEWEYAEPEPEPAYEPEPEPEPEAEQPTTSFQALPREPDPEPVSDPEPAAPAPPEPATTAYPYPPLRERVALRRRARQLAAVREIQLRDLGGFLVELQRFGARRPDLVRAKLEAAMVTDAEWRELHHRLDEEAPLGEVRTPGIGGACADCGAVHGSLDRFCASCGQPL